MNKLDLCRELAVRAEIPLKKSKDIMGFLQDIVFEHMKDEEGVKLFDGVVFKTAYRDAYVARKPSDGTPVNVPAKYVPKASFGKAPKEYVNR